MGPKNAFYVPCLRWRLAERQALAALTDKAKDAIVPLITLPDLEFDFEDGMPKKTVGDHVGSFPKRYKEKWKTRKAWIDADLKIQTQAMPDGRPVFTFVFDEIRMFKAEAIPVASLDCTPSVIAQIAAIAAVDKKGVGIRARIEHVMKASFGPNLDALLKALNTTPEQADLIIDLGTPNYEPYIAFAGALAPALATIPNLQAYRNFILAGCAFPDSLKDVAVPFGYIARHDWRFYVELLAKIPAGARSPMFGDYTTVHPAFTATMDMRKVKPAGKVVYATNDRWYVRKGGAFRDNPAQMHNLCEDVVKSGHFTGPGFSDGDDYIARCATKMTGPSNQTRWKSVGINHHIMQVIGEIATLAVTP
ncbi:beta family protein [Bradyrhizobium sp. 76]|uniref:beta family protein n=1 Tax=Bradyrhizobium sp. 76 TaxID=2782680 RepID=UPI001FFAEE2F|nr:beta family protein [Bradyrhizobium sp. 76]MCK1409295.1 beta family protein [Bradyrhizobium sp. 76]